MLLKRSWRTEITVDYPEGINIHKTHLQPVCPRTEGLLSAAPGSPAVAIQLRLAADTAISQLEKLPKGNFSGGAAPLKNKASKTTDNFFMKRLKIHFAF